jgi:hypothetical protein
MFLEYIYGLIENNALKNCPYFFAKEKIRERTLFFESLRAHWLLSLADEVCDSL